MKHQGMATEPPIQSKGTSFLFSLLLLATSASPSPSTRKATEPKDEAKRMDLLQRLNFSPEDTRWMINIQCQRVIFTGTCTILEEKRGKEKKKKTNDIYKSSLPTTPTIRQILLEPAMPMLRPSIHVSSQRLPFLSPLAGQCHISKPTHQISTKLRTKRYPKH